MSSVSGMLKELLVLQSLFERNVLIRKVNTGVLILAVVAESV
jgi:hypothetical protein